MRVAKFGGSLASLWIFPGVDTKETIHIYVIVIILSARLDSTESGVAFSSFFFFFFFHAREQ